MSLKIDAVAIELRLREFDSELIMLAESHKLRIGQLHAALSQAASEYQLQMDDIRRRMKSWRSTLVESDRDINAADY